MKNYHLTYAIIAKITSAFGIKGLVKIVSFAQNPADFAKYSGRIFDDRDNKYEIKIINQIPSQNNNVFVVEIAGVKDRNQAELLRNIELFVARGDLKNPKKDEFYHIDLIGLDVLSSDKQKIGKVMAVNDFGAGGIVEIKFNDEFCNHSGIENFSFTNDNFPEVNLKEGFLVLNLPEVIEVEAG